ncbi:phosphotransferase [Actinomadura violacea]|uniref:Phosphotransferase n=1 Tax=Actinomadura violacea TaxID=2819934 RepID=A0ABS3SCP9_9ACTN|nr:phosphotransferase [Actinomadura violacea]MBO2465999.1 phosphotransferase [Actinomadura violacea]
MFSEPDDPDIRERMHAAFADGTRQLGTTPADGTIEAWGHGGRTLGAPVTTSHGSAWLRVLEAPEGKAGGKLWTGTQEAAATLPTELPRPRLLNSTDWAREGYAYRAELSTYIAAPVCSPSPDLTEHITLPDAWWARLQRATSAVATTPAPHNRPRVITQDYIHRTIPRYLGNVGIDTTVRRWTLAHGDLHWANLTSPELTILDWEGFGPAPHGFDAAHLYAYTLLVPELAAHVRATFAGALATLEGRLAEFTVAAVLLQAADRDPIHARLAPRIREHAQSLLDPQRYPQFS